MIKHSPFRYFKTSPEIIRLAVMLYVRFPLSLRNVEDLLHERGIDAGIIRFATVARHPEVIRLAVMLYVRFPLSLRNVEDLLHERGIEISHETVRFWWNRFGPMSAEVRCSPLFGPKPF